MIIWTPGLSNQAIQKSLQYWNYSMNDIQFKQLLDKFDQQFSEEIYTRSNDVNWTIPSLQPTSFIVLHEKTFTDDLHFIPSTEGRVIRKKLKWVCLCVCGGQRSKEHFS